MQPIDGDHSSPEDELLDAMSAAEAEQDASQQETEKSFAELEQELDRMRDQLYRAAADAENTRKRAAKEVQDGKTYAVTAFARDLLSVADNMSRALSTVSEQQRQQMGEAGKNLLTGVEMTERELMSVFGRHGVQRIEAKGEKFDPNKHQAVAHIPSENAPKDHVAEVMQAGFMIGQRVLRPAMVAVSSGAPAKPADPAASKAADAAKAAGAAIHGDGAPAHKVDTKI